MFKIKIEKIKSTRKRKLPLLRVGELQDKVQYISNSAFLKDDENGEILRWIFNEITGYWSNPVRITKHQYDRAVGILSK